MNMGVSTAIGIAIGAAMGSATGDMGTWVAMRVRAGTCVRCHSQPKGRRQIKLTLSVANSHRAASTPEPTRHCGDSARSKSVLSPGFSQRHGHAWRSIGRHLVRYGLGQPTSHTGHAAIGV